MLTPDVGAPSTAPFDVDGAGSTKASNCALLLLPPAVEVLKRSPTRALAEEDAPAKELESSPTKEGESSWKKQK